MQITIAHQLYKSAITLTENLFEMKIQRCVNRLVGITTLLCIIGLPCCIHAQQLTVVAVSHQTDEYDYTTTSPRNSNTNCNVYDSSVNCNTTSYGGVTQTHAVYRLYQTVTSAQGGQLIQYKLTRTARWRWNSTDYLTDGDSFSAEIKGKHMFITCRKGGNQGKKETLKYDILDIRPVH